MPQHIMDEFESRARAGDGQFAIAYAMMEVARAAKSAAYALERLGLGDAATPMGAIELLSKGLNDGASDIADAIRAVAEAD
jgi:hypothetical protein